MFLIAVTPVLSNAQSTEIRIDSLSSLLGKDVGQVSILLAPLNWKLLNSNRVTKGDKVERTFVFGYSLNITQKTPKAGSWLDIVTLNGYVSDIKYQFYSGDDYSNVINQLKEMGAKQIGTTIINRGIRVDFMTSTCIYNLISATAINSKPFASYYLEIQNSDTYFKR